ncbi:protein S100-A16 [Alligator mississippiensis]|nr:protein S100-A16 [Alligator mississippiensis]XP_025050001.1 protein S100-A16-like [Alligator sinensis]XP_025050003.1 protein S100-A16-like [Alligator sinensis]
MGQNLQPEGPGDGSGGQKHSERSAEDSALEKGIYAIVDSFYKYAKGQAEAKALDQEAFQSLLSNELSHQLTNTEIKEAVKGMFDMLDANKDQKISFDEYWQLITWICQVIRHRDYSA